MRRPSTSAFVLAGLLGALAVLIAWTALPRTAPAPVEIVHLWLDVRPVRRARADRGICGDDRGTAGLRQWIVVFLASCAAGQVGAVQGWSMMWAGALIGLLGVPAGLLGNELALQVGLRTTAMDVFALSAVVVNMLFAK